MTYAKLQLKFQKNKNYSTIILNLHVHINQGIKTSVVWRTNLCHRVSVATDKVSYKPVSL